jgi:F-type H+-transporting ATPase subunit epsilon
MVYCELRSPDRTFYQGEAVSVTARSSRGEFAVLAHHAPLLAELSPGSIRIRTATEEREYACFGGTLSTDGARIVILGREIVPREEIHTDELRKLLDDPSRSPPEVAELQARIALLEKVAGRHG